MKNVTLGLQPFKDYWVNCTVNGQFSILCTMEPSYRYAAYLNDYHYQVSSTTMKESLAAPYPYLESYSMGDVHSRYIGEFFSYEAFSLRSEANFPEMIKDLIRQKKIVSVGVNLFEWIPHSLGWKKHQWSHYTLMDGFDDERDVFYVLDDDFQGYGYHEIPRERFCNAVKAAKTDPEGVIVNVGSEIEPFELTMDEVLFFSRRLKAELESLTMESLWRVREEEAKNWVVFDLFVMYIFQIANRQKANALLFQALSEKNLIVTPKTIAELIQQAADLQKEWQNLGKKLIKSHHLHQNRMKPNELYDSYQYLIGKEIKMWSYLLSAME